MQKHKRTAPLFLSRSLASVVSRVSRLAALSGIAALSACAAVWGFEEPLDPATSPALVGDGSVAEGRAPGCEDEKVDDVAGVFVVGGATAAGDAAPAEDPLCGAKDDPCVRIATGLTRARDLGKSIVYVVRGVYTEALNVPAGITLEGGWNALRTGGTIAYAKACADAPGTSVVIQAPDGEATAVLVDDTDKPVVLQDLTIQSEAVAAPSESLYGVRVRGATNKPSLSLVDVNVTVASGGDGSSGASGAAGEDATGACTPPYAGAAPPPDGDAGASGTVSGATFASDGLVASNGSDGATGALGNAGVAATPATPVTCFASCTPPGTLHVGAACTGAGGVSTAGASGASGCGGKGGAGGKGGKGGGSSVAVYVWNATFSTTRGSLSAGDGGKGGAGGKGGEGGEGALGAKGDDSSPCVTDCGSSLLGTDCASQTKSTSAGTAGTSGSKGGSGGAGAPGAGGDSFVVAVAGGGSVTLDPSTAVHVGSPGVAPAGGVGGKAAIKGAP